MNPTAPRPHRARTGRATLTLSAALALVACSSSGPADTAADTTSAGTGTGGGASNCQPDAPATPPDDFLAPTRALRRIALSFTGRAPVASEYQAILDAKDDTARQTILDKAVDDALASPVFYEVMREFGREWMGLPSIVAAADEPDYVASQQNNIAECPAGTMYPGALAAYNPNAPDVTPCGGKNKDGSDALIQDIEPWWAPGTKVTVIGYAANPASTMTTGGKTHDCGAVGVDSPNYPSHECGCGPHLSFCHLSGGVGYANWQIYSLANPQGQRRLLWEEPARLIAHIGWNDRPLSDVVLGNYSVGPVEVQAAYVRAARRGGATQLDKDDSWWQPASFSGVVDPGHSSMDPWAWREFTVATRDPYLLAERDYEFDPRNEPRNSMKGIPAAGILTMIGMLGANTRERVRAARMLETFACEAFIPPPPDQKFNPYVSDPAAEGPCQACHTRIDPAAIHFKRWSKHGADIDLDGGGYFMPGIGNWTTDDGWTTGAYPFDRDPFAHWFQWWKPETKMTPISKADADKNPQARFIDFLPPDQTLLGQKSDGTVGPLGFAKMIVASGAFDRCAVRHLHERFGGRAINPATEPGYLDGLVDKFVKGGRKVRPFLKQLTQTDTFRRGL
jgi:hypothetical protein